MALTVGNTATLAGNVTKLKAIAATPPASVEHMLGYHPGRLAGGYWICVLIAPLATGDFEFDGTTLRSGGRMGNPFKSITDDDRRPRVHDVTRDELGVAGYDTAKKAALTFITASGPERIAKVVPVMPHMKYGSPAKQYPPGEGALQWKLVSTKTFLVAAFVNAQGLAQTPQFKARVDFAAPYDDRARLMRYLATAGT